ncbi:hypothetical protein D3C59_36445 [Streptomyces sp. SHP22-7]|nr:hypothetical protein D3C59_36445 [Streptomyces sp. SHP22-7]
MYGLIGAGRAVVAAAAGFPVAGGGGLPGAYRRRLTWLLRFGDGFGVRGVTAPVERIFRERTDFPDGACWIRARICVWWRRSWVP